MARYVVLEFVDNAEADYFVTKVMQECAVRRKEGNLFKRRIAGIFVKPGRTCECTDRHRANHGDKNNHGASIARGEKFGWWVCTRCNRPRAAGHQLNNQLDMSDTHEGMVFNDYEFCVTNIDVTGIHTKQIKRPKKLRRKKEKK